MPLKVYSFQGHKAHKAALIIKRINLRLFRKGWPG